ncbi:sigma-54-dependent Fis family transcriptional regulator [Pseudoalteromonas arabiensis]|uniref:sigma-54-dependent Fis family transcriptional regulator n=1 Tax=Pseudoalteromonas arabiensis TaxID=874454 RepID=UPI000780EB02|nr:sigma-54-dependent Fis family transcriptional regulator [Pseudoalteromonas arabiensis]
MKHTPHPMDVSSAQSFMSTEFQLRNIQPSKYIARSWKRSLLNYGLDPYAFNEVEVLSSSEMRSQLQLRETFLNTGKCGLVGLANRIADVGYSAILTDATGLTLATSLSTQEESLSKQSGLLIGARWAENQVGTNGIGTCLIEKAPLIIHKAEHFYASHKELSCSVTPIFDPMGELLGCLNASCIGADQNKHHQLMTLKMVMLYGRMIENSYLHTSYKNQLILSIKSAESFFDITQEQLIAINEKGTIIGANHAAFFCFMSHFQSHQSLLGINVEQFIGLSLDSLLSKTNGGNNAVNVQLPLLSENVEITLKVPKSKALPLAQAEPKVQSKTFTKHPPINELNGEDASMQQLVRRALLVADKDIPIMITGETGTGKEAFARAIHESSPRADKAFVALNCAAIPETLIESELFGYLGGSFTGAHKKGMKGKLEQANGGTLFLDEIGDMPVQLQTRLLRVLAERETMPLGGIEPIALDLQVISATHQDLKTLIELKEFREDFYYRLNGMVLKLPALRERSDKSFIIDNILERECMAVHGLSIADDAKRALESYFWPGNIRQLISVIKYAVAVCEGAEITINCFPDDLIEHFSSLTDHKTAGSFKKEKALAKFTACHEEQLLIETLKKHRWNITSVSEELNVCRSTVYRKMEKYKIVQPNNAC